MIRMRAHNVGKVVIELGHLGERVVDNARKTMHAAAKRIEKKAKLNAPVDEHNLEDSIRIERYTVERGRLALEVVAGGEVNGVNVDDYAALMHEGDYNLGPGSIAKQQANPDVVVGRKYLERARDEEEETLDEKMIHALRRILPR